MICDRCKKEIQTEAVVKIHSKIDGVEYIYHQACFDLLLSDFINYLHEIEKKK
jgi:hypothetical protein